MAKAEHDASSGKELAKALVLAGVGFHIITRKAWVGNDDVGDFGPAWFVLPPNFYFSYYFVVVFFFLWAFYFIVAFLFLIACDGDRNIVWNTGEKDYVEVFCGWERLWGGVCGWDRVYGLF